MLTSHTSPNKSRNASIYFICTGKFRELIFATSHKEVELKLNLKNLLMSMFDKQLACAAKLIKDSLFTAFHD